VLGEVIMDARDIRRPLGLPYTPPLEAVTAVAGCRARRNFTVRSRSTIEALRVEATDATDGPSPPARAPGARYGPCVDDGDGGTPRLLR
jgi:hypothetical protein